MTLFISAFSIVSFASKFLTKPRSFMYLIVIAWIYVVLMMSVAEATNSTGTLLGALLTFVLYGLGPVALVVYLMGAPARSKAIKKREADERALRSAAGAAGSPVSDAASVEPDAGGHATGSSETTAGARPVRKEP
jgi:hypothetical protein